MSRNNVFKMSGNMALGSNDGYPSGDFDNIKSSLKLLKSKQGQKRNEPPMDTNVTRKLLRICMAGHIHQILNKDSHPYPRVHTFRYRSRLSKLQLPTKTTSEEPTTVI